MENKELPEIIENDEHKLCEDSPEKACFDCAADRADRIYGAYKDYWKYGE